MLLPVSRPDAGQAPLPAPVMAFLRYGVFGVEPSRLTQAAVLVHGGDKHPAPSSLLPLLVMKVTAAPQPIDEFSPPNGHLPTPSGKRQPSVGGGGACGGLATAIAEAEIGSVLMPSTRRNDV